MIRADLQLKKKLKIIKVDQDPFAENAVLVRFDLPTENWADRQLDEAVEYRRGENGKKIKRMAQIFTLSNEKKE